MPGRKAGGGMERTGSNRWWIKSVITVPDRIGTKIQYDVATGFHVLNCWAQRSCACICSPSVRWYVEKLVSIRLCIKEWSNSFYGIWKDGRPPMNLPGSPPRMPRMYASKSFFLAHWMAIEVVNQGWKGRKGQAFEALTFLTNTTPVCAPAPFEPFLNKQAVHMLKIHKNGPEGPH
jgi:hypothetical protein